MNDVTRGSVAANVDRAIMRSVTRLYCSLVYSTLLDSTGHTRCRVVDHMRCSVPS